MIRFRHDSSDGGDYGDAREVCEEICYCGLQALKNASGWKA